MLIVYIPHSGIKLTSSFIDFQHVLEEVLQTVWNGCGEIWNHYIYLYWLHIRSNANCVYHTPDKNYNSLEIQPSSVICSSCFFTLAGKPRSIFLIHLHSHSHHNSNHSNPDHRSGWDGALPECLHGLFHINPFPTLLNKYL